MSLLSPTLEAFWAVVQKGTVQEASHILGITQTGVTQRIRSLEKQLETTLFIRSRKGMKLTTEGESLLQYVKLSLENEGMTLSKIQKASFEHIIEIGISGPSSILRSRVIPNLLSQKAKYPKVRFRFDLSDGIENQEKLKTGQCDLAILEHQEVTKEMDSRILRAERFKLYVPKAWKKRKLLDVVENEAIIDFDPSDRMTYQYLEKYRLKNKAQPNRHYANNTDALLSMIEMGVGYSVLAEDFAKDAIKKGEIVDISPDQFFDYKIALAWYYRPEMPEYFKAIIKAIS
ncbi:MAG: LysR family transcriptional regulator [Pseudobdellovibrio sp.]|nr:LysR family transcriptional regulator [Pseudobdellovibrio sp.]